MKNKTTAPGIFRTIGLLTLLLVAGCATPPPSTKIYAVTPEVENYRPTPSAVRIETSISITRTNLPYLPPGSNWRSVPQAVFSEILKAGLFAREILPADGLADYSIEIDIDLSIPLRITIHLRDENARRELGSFTRRASASVDRFQLEAAIREVMAGLKTDLVSALKAVGVPTAETQTVVDQKRMAEKREADREALAALRTTRLQELLVAAETSSEMARARNHAIIAAKDEQLPGILQEWKTAELAALGVKIEQTVLDLNHACEVAKDRAQQATAAGETSGSIDQLRDLAISYRERIELLKPILGALKDEIANRSR